MRLQNLRPEVQRLLSIVIPALVLLLTIALVLPKVTALRNLNRQGRELRRQATQAPHVAVERAAQPVGRHPVAPETRDEQLIFLRELSQIVSASRVQLLSYRPPTAPASKPEEKAELSNKLITPKATEVALTGSYSNLMVFFSALANMDRLFTVESLQLKTDSYPRLSATFRLVRYVTPAGPDPAVRPEGT
jgi:hypothetical protein